MKIEEQKTVKLKLTDLTALDPITVFSDDIGQGQGSITITCYGKAWTAYWGGIGLQTINEFFCSNDEDYLAGKLSDIDSEIYDIDRIRSQAEIKGIDCWRDDPWNDYLFLSQLYGDDMYEWSNKIPMKTNPEYAYLCRIIKAVKQALNTK